MWSSSQPQIIHQTVVLLNRHWPKLQLGIASLKRNWVKLLVGLLFTAFAWHRLACWQEQRAGAHDFLVGLGNHSALFVTNGTAGPTFTTNLLQLLRYCGAPAVDPDLVQEAGVNMTILQRSYLSPVPRVCRIHVLVTEPAKAWAVASIASLARPTDGGSSSLWRHMLGGTQHASTRCKLENMQIPAHRLIQPPTDIGKQLQIQVQTLYSCWPGINVTLYNLEMMSLSNTFTKLREAYRLDEKNIYKWLWLIRLIPQAVFPNEVKYLTAIDSDTLMLKSLDGLLAHYRAFSPQQLFGMAIQMDPRYELDDRFNGIHDNCKSCMFGKEKGFPGFDDGVMLYHLDNMRSSETYKALAMDPAAVDNYLKEVYPSSDPLKYGAADFFTLLALRHSELFYVLPCEWNYQLCMTNRRTTAAGFHMRCDQPPKLYHANCGSDFPSKDYGLAIIYWSQQRLEILEIQNRDWELFQPRNWTALVPFLQTRCNVTTCAPNKV